MNSLQPFIGSKEIIGEYVTKFKPKNEFDEDSAIMIIESAINELLTADNYSIYIVHEKIYNNKAKLPKNFKYPLQVAYRTAKIQKEIYSKSDVFQKLDFTFSENCHSKLNYKCKRCHETECNCGEYEVFPLELKTNDQSSSNAVKIDNTPDIAERVSKFLIGYTKYNNTCVSKFNKNFEIIKPTYNYFFNLPNIIKNCNIPNLNTRFEYRISDGIIEVNDTNNYGEVLISYLGKKIDENGLLMIPNERLYIDAIIARLAEGLALIEYNQSQTQSSRVFWMDMSTIATKKVARARNFFKIPNMDNWDEFLNIAWLKRISYDNIEDKSWRYEPDQYVPQTNGNNYTHIP